MVEQPFMPEGQINDNRIAYEDQDRPEIHRCGDDNENACDDAADYVGNRIRELLLVEASKKE